MAAPVMEEWAAHGVNNALLTITHGFTINEGDLLFAYHHGTVVAYPSGWTTVSQGAYLVAGASEPSSYTWDARQSFNRLGVILVRISGAEDPATTDIVAESGTSPTSPSVTPTDADSLVLMTAATNYDSTTWTKPSGETLVGTLNSDLRSLAMIELEWGASATGTRAWTYSPGWHSTYLTTSMSYAFAPSGGGGGGGIEILRRRIEGC